MMIAGGITGRTTGEEGRHGEKKEKRKVPIFCLLPFHYCLLPCLSPCSLFPRGYLLLARLIFDPLSVKTTNVVPGSQQSITQIARALYIFGPRRFIPRFSGGRVYAADCGRGLPLKSRRVTEYLTAILPGRAGKGRSSGKGSRAQSR